MKRIVKKIKKMTAVGLAASVLFSSTVFVYGDEPLNSAAFPRTIETAVSTTLQHMEQLGIAGLTIALVDAETGFTWTQGFGYADSINQVPVDEHTLFQIASVSKPFTAVAIMQLVEQGVVDLDEPLITYIPEFSVLPNPSLGGNSDNITVRMLLSNTSGVPRDFMIGFYTTGNEHYQGVMNDRLLEWLPTREMNFVEGTKYEYSNINWTLLGILVARMTGHTNYAEGFTQHASENIFEPLGMSRSTFMHTEGLENVAMPYIVTDYLQQPKTLVSKISAGSMFSSAYDMSRFMHTMLGDSTVDGFLTQETIAYMLQSHTEHVEMAPGVHYGLGFAQQRTGDIVTVGHSGGALHFFTDMIFDMEHNLGVFVSSNSVTGMFASSPIAATILQSAIAEKTGLLSDIPADLASDEEEEAVVPIELSAQELEEFMAEFGGNYDFFMFGLWELILEDGVLYWVSEDETNELVPMSNGTFATISGFYEFGHEDGYTITMFSIPGVAQLPGIMLRDGEDLAVAISEDMIPPEGFEQWAGIYDFTPQLENEVSRITQLVVGINDAGLATLQIISPRTEMVLGATPPMPFPFQDGIWLTPLGNAISFELDDNGAARIDMGGALFIRR